MLLQRKGGRGEVREIELLQERPAAREGGREVEFAEGRENLEGLCLYGQAVCVCTPAGMTGKYSVIMWEWIVWGIILSIQVNTLYIILHVCMNSIAPKV